MRRYRRKWRSAFNSDSDNESDVGEGKEEEDASEEDLPVVKIEKTEEKKSVKKRVKGEKDTDQVSTWTEAKAAVVPSAGPSNFVTSFSWVTSEASKEHLLQLVGALNLPSTPFKASLTHHSMQRWWKSQRAVLLKRKCTFVDAVRQTYLRHREDGLKLLRDRESAQDLRQKARDSYVENFDNDRKTMSKNDFIWTVIFPIDVYESIDNMWDSQISSRLKGTTKLGKQQLNVAKDRRNPSCKPLLCKVWMNKIPGKNDGHPPASVRHWNPHSTPEVKLHDPLTVRFLQRPLVDPNPMTFDAKKTLLNEWCPDNSNVTLFRIPAHVNIKLTPPSFTIGASDNFEWISWLKTENLQGKPSKNIGKPKSSLRNPENEIMSSDDDIDDDDDDEIGLGYAVAKGRFGPSSTIGMLRLLMEETRRYRRLVKLFTKFKHVTTVKSLWTLILEFQITI